MNDTHGAILVFLIFIGIPAFLVLQYIIGLAGAIIIAVLVLVALFSSIG